MKKLNVGVALQGDPQTGITLIALIITIIVMLVLVGVTINVALNGGLFDKAKNAGQLTQREVDKEYLLSLITGTLSNTGDLQITTGNLTKDDWTAEQSENEDYLKCTSPKDEVFYVNTKTGAILDELPEKSEDTYYNISFKDLSGVDLLSVFPEINNYEANYMIGFNSESGSYSGIIVNTHGLSCYIQYFPDVTNNSYFQYAYNGDVEEKITPWTYYFEESTETKNPPELKNVTAIDYTAGSSNGMNDFTETMLESICNVTKVK